MGSAATWAAIAAALLGTTVATYGYRHSQEQLDTAKKVALDAEVDRRIERHITHRRRAIEAMADHLAAVEELGPLLEYAHRFTNREMWVSQLHGKPELMWGVEDEKGRTKVRPAAEGMQPALDYIHRTIYPSAIRLRASADGTRLAEVASHADFTIDEIRQQLLQWQRYAREGDEEAFHDPREFTGPRLLTTLNAELPRQIEQMVKRYVSLAPDRVASDIRGSWA